MSTNSSDVKNATQLTLVPSFTGSIRELAAIHADVNVITRAVLEDIAENVSKPGFLVADAKDRVLECIQIGASAEDIRAELQGNASQGYFTGESQARMQALADAVRDWMKKNDQTPGIAADGITGATHDPL